MNFNEMLKNAGLDPSEVLILRHTPQEPHLRRQFGWIASERPDLFGAYQAVQFPRVEKAMTKARAVAAFLGVPNKRALFIGVYRKHASTEITRKQFWANPSNVILRDTFGMKGWGQDDSRKFAVEFDLKELKQLQDWKGRVVVDWPGKELAWFRWADKNNLAVRCIHEQSELCSQLPEWNKLLLTWPELQVLPKSWKSAISQWRGVYLIYDRNDRMMYVGSAYGKENIYQRWMNYAKTGHGGNQHLKNRPPESFVFSILQLVPVDIEPRYVIQLEVTWMNRLHSFYPSGLNDKKAKLEAS